MRISSEYAYNNKRAFYFCTTRRLVHETLEHNFQNQFNFTHLDELRPTRQETPPPPTRRHRQSGRAHNQMQIMSLRGAGPGEQQSAGAGGELMAHSRAPQDDERIYIICSLYNLPFQPFSHNYEQICSFRIVRNDGSEGANRNLCICIWHASRNSYGVISLVWAYAFLLFFIALRLLWYDCLWFTYIC